MTWTSCSALRPASPYWSTAPCWPRDRPTRSRATRRCAPSIWASRAMAELLRVEGLRSGYGEAIVIDGVSLNLDVGRSLALLGRNGTGKTTLINTLVGVTLYREGTIRLNGSDLTSLRADQRAAMGIG